MNKFEKFNKICETLNKNRLSCEVEAICQNHVLSHNSCKNLFMHLRRYTHDTRQMMFFKRPIFVKKADH